MYYFSGVDGTEAVSQIQNFVWETTCSNKGYLWCKYMDCQKNYLTLLT